MKPKHYIFSILLVIIGSVVAYFLVPAYADYRRAHKEQQRLEQDLAELAIQTQHLEETIHNLQTNPKAVERVAREKFGWCRNNEKIYHFDPSDQKSSPGEP
ncbi:MAG: septum formation initiator family protein [Lentisphaeria bacterium]